jgi:endo-beta-N-acetylglucosaminidase D
LNDVCLSEGFHSLMVQTHSLWNTQGRRGVLPRWRWWRRWRRR